MDQIKLLISLFGEHRIKLNEPLEFYTFSKFDGHAEAFFIATTTIELVDIVTAAQDLFIPYQVFGAGTKMVFSQKIVQGLVIKNRTGNIKISGVKGKVGQSGIGVEEALLEVDSGVSLGKINQFLEAQKLSKPNFVSHQDATLGGSLPIESSLHPITQKVRVLDKDEIVELEIPQLRKNHIILSAILKIKA